MTVGELRALLAGVPDELEIVVRAEDDDGNSFCGGIATAEREHGCDDEQFFAIDCEPDAESEET